MKDIKEFQYPLWVRILLWTTAFLGLAMVVYLVGFLGFLVYLSSGSLVTIGVASVFALAIVGFFGRTCLGMFVAFPKVEIDHDRMKVSGLFFSSDWFALDDISSVEMYKSHDLTGLFFRNFYVVGCEKLPWPSRFVSWTLRPLVGKVGRCFLVGQRVQGFDELSRVLEGGRR